MERSQFDPRYSREFQRGFDPATQAGGVSEPRPTDRIEPVQAPPTPAARRAAASSDAGSPVPDEPGLDETTDDTGLEATEPSPTPWRNPYLVALVVVGIVLIGGGISAFRWAVRLTFSGSEFGEVASQEELEELMIAAQLAWGLSPLLALAGVLTLLGVFFFFAQGWRPRRRLAEDESNGIPDGGMVD